MDLLDERFPLSYAEPGRSRRRWLIVALWCAAIAAGIVVAVLFLLSGDPAGAAADHGMG